MKSVKENLFLFNIAPNEQGLGHPPYLKTIGRGRLTLASVTGSPFFLNSNLNDMKRIIFLDIDGVLNVYPQGRDKYGSTFHTHFEDNLHELIEKTGAEIVISSTWRYSGLKVMQNMWRDRGLAGKVIDITCRVP